MLQCRCGAALNALLVLLQIIDAMWKPSAYDWVYPLSYLFTFTIATPHSILVQLAYPEKNLKQGEPLCGHSAALEHEAAQSPHTGIPATKHSAVDFRDVQANWVPQALMLLCPAFKGPAGDHRIPCTVLGWNAASAAYRACMRGKIPCSLHLVLCRQRVWSAP